MADRIVRRRGADRPAPHRADVAAGEIRRRARKAAIWSSFSSGQRAGDIDEPPARPDQIGGLVEQRPLLADPQVELPVAQPPFGIGLAPPRARAGARRIDEDAVEPGEPGEPAGWSAGITCALEGTPARCSRSWIGLRRWRSRSWAKIWPRFRMAAAIAKVCRPRPCAEIEDLHLGLRPDQQCRDLSPHPAARTSRADSRPRPHDIGRLLTASGTGMRMHSGDSGPGTAPNFSRVLSTLAGDVLSVLALRSIGRLSAAASDAARSPNALVEEGTSHGMSPAMCSGNRRADAAAARRRRSSSDSAPGPSSSSIAAEIGPRPSPEPWPRRGSGARRVCFHAVPSGTAPPQRVEHQIADGGRRPSRRNGWSRAQSFSAWLAADGAPARHEGPRLLPPPGHRPHQSRGADSWGPRG